MRGSWLAEGPTWALIVVIYLGWGLLIWYFNDLPLWLALPAGAWLIAWHGSLQHEALHGHPTPITWLNSLIAGAPLGLWMPYGVYRESHLRHHQTERLTDPQHDPESFYLTAKQWQRTGRLGRGLLIANNTLLGRLTLGPGLTIWRYWHGELGAILAGDFRHCGILVMHVALVSLVLLWVGGVAGMPVGFYLVIMYGGLSLTLMRSFLEHRPATLQQHRTVIVEAGLVWRLLFLNNNLHVLHHGQPSLPWYDLGREYGASRDRLRASNGGYVFAGYGDVARRYLVTPKDRPVAD